VGWQQAADGNAGTAAVKPLQPSLSRFAPACSAKPLIILPAAQQYGTARRGNRIMGWGMAGGACINIFQF